VRLHACILAVNGRRARFMFACVNYTQQTWQGAVAIEERWRLKLTKYGVQRSLLAVDANDSDSRQSD
jgi:hypothetical protein